MNVRRIRQVCDYFLSLSALEVVAITILRLVRIQSSFRTGHLIDIDTSC